MRCRSCLPMVLASAVMLGGAAGCSSTRIEPALQSHRVAPASQPGDVDALKLEASRIKPLYRELLAIDLPTALRTAVADNLDIRSARQRVEESRGELESAVGGTFPVIVPTAAFEHVEGTVRAVRGDLVGAGFNTFSPSVAVQWVLNPGAVVYEIIAARKRLSAVEHEEQYVRQEALRQTAVQYYDLALAQHGVSTADQAVREAQELLRINRLREQTGLGVPVDVLRAEARLAQTQQDLISAVNAFYQASVALAVTLHLDSTVTLIPRSEQLPPIVLVDPALSLDELVEIAVACRPDLKHVRMLVEAAAATYGSTWWGSFGPQFQVGYQFGGITGHSNNTEPGQGIPGNLVVNPLSPTGSFSSNPLVNGIVKEGITRASRQAARAKDQTFGLKDQQRFNASAGWRFSVSAIGDLRSAGAFKEQAIIEAERAMDQLKAQVVVARQACQANRELMLLSQRQMSAADETLRLSQANLQAGTMTTLDVLQAQEAASQARLRHAEAIIRYNQSQVNLLASLGALQPLVPHPPSGPAD